MPQGSAHGWGIAGTYLTDEIAKLPPVDGVTLHCITRHDFMPYDESAWNLINIGYCFFEHELLARPFIADAARRWDHIVAGSSWCEKHLRSGGMEQTSTILQGIDSSFFFRQPPRPNKDRFIVFSGGKFEYRKGQDIVIAAMRIFMERHKDAWLSCAWHNQWPNSLKTMAQSRLIDFKWQDIPCRDLLIDTISRNGLDPERVLIHPLLDNSRMPLVYSESDIGIFPNRCEGGNNLVMCEYMACGRTVIASDRTGHRDVITQENALCLSSYHPRAVMSGQHESGIWPEPSYEEVLELLEQAYLDRQMLVFKGSTAAGDMSRLTWKEAALKFHSLAIQLASRKAEMPVIQVDETRAKRIEADNLFEAGRYDAAEAIYRQLLGRFPLDAELYNALATVLDRQERYREAILHYHKALALDPGLHVAIYNLANTLRRTGDESGALGLLCRLAEEQPGLVEAWKSLAMIHISRDSFAEAAVCFERLLKLMPGDVESRCALGTMYAELGRFGDAVACYKAVLELQPNNLLALESMGTSLHELDQLEQAEECFRRVLAIEPQRISALNNLGTVIRSLARLDEAINIFDYALSLAPDNGQIRFNRGVARLARGDLPEAWEDYEARFNTRAPTRLYHPELPRWNGEPLNGRCLLVQSEQGFGDTFQFVRYLPLLANAGGPVVFECQNSSIREALVGIENLTILARGELLPKADCQIPLTSLAPMFRTTLESIPSPGAYLKPSQQKLLKWGERLALDAGRLNIGLVWGGNKYSLNANRSLQLSQLESLLGLPGVNWYSLQLGPDAEQLVSFSHQVMDLGREIDDFGDTAAIIASLDLVLTIDSAVAHLAGALGVPVWIMLKYSPDWRWLLHRSDSPWYASALLFRQHSPGDWGEVVASVRMAIKKKLESKKIN